MVLNLSNLYYHLQCCNCTSAERHATAKVKLMAESDVLGITKITFGKGDILVNFTY